MGVYLPVILLSSLWRVRGLDALWKVSGLAGVAGENKYISCYVVD